MVESENVHSSWADEVEKEEEKTKALLQEKSKPNPFGSARPREVILQERGIDWRKLDLHLQHSSPTSEVNSSKENTPASIINPNQMLKAENLGFNQSAASNIMPVLVVPPLRYPPRNMVASLSESSCLEVQRRDFQYKSRSTPKKQNAVHRNGSAVQLIGKERNFREPAIDKDNMKAVQSTEKGRNFRNPAIHSYRQNMSGALLGRPPANQPPKHNIGG